MSIEEQFESMFRDIAARAFDGRTEEEIERVVASGRLDEALNETIPRVASVLAGTLVETAPEMLAERAGALTMVAEEVRRAYGPGLDLCEMVLRIASEIGEEYANRHLQEEQVPALHWVLAHLHARARRLDGGAVMLP